MRVVLRVPHHNPGRDKAPSANVGRGVLTVAEVEQYLALGHESRSFEVKGPVRIKDRGFCAKVAKAAMAIGEPA